MAAVLDELEPEVQGATCRLTPLHRSLVVGYSAGSLVDGVVTNGLAMFQLFYVTAVCGLSGGLAGLALSAGLVVDAVMDPLIGSLSDAWRSRWGRRLPFMLVGAPLTAALFVAVFSLPARLGQTQLFVSLMVLSILLRISLSLYLLPYQAVGAELSDDYRERSILVAWRWMASVLGVLIALLLGFGLFFTGPAGLTRRGAYTPFAVSLAGVALAGAGGAAFAVAATRDRQHRPPPDAGSAFKVFLVGLGEVIRNRSFRVLFVGSLLFFTAMGVNSALGLHANTYFWALKPSEIQAVMMAGFLGMLLGAPFTGPLLRRLEKRTVLVLGMAGLALSQGGPVSLRLAGALPLSGGALTLLLAVVAAGGGVLLAAAAIAFGSMMADAADEHEYLFGARREGLYFAGWAFSSKAAVGAGTLVAGLALQLIGFPSGAPGGHAAAPPPRVIELLGASYGPGAAALTFAAVAVTLMYRLDRRAHAELLEELQRRRRVAAMP